MGAVETTYTFTATDTITSTKMNNIIDQTFMTGDAISGSTLEVTSSGRLKVRSAGITSNELASDSVTSAKILDGTIVNADINASAAIGLSKLATGALPTAITIASANIVDGTIVAGDISNATITAPKLDGAQSGTAPIFGVRAWAKLNPFVGSIRTGAYKTGNYSRTATETTVTIVGHGLKTNDKIRLDFTSGTATDGLYTVTSSANANEFVVDHTGSATSGNVTAQFVAIQGSGNVSTASWYDSGDDRIVLNFTTQMPNDNYATLVTGQYYPGAFSDSGSEDTLGTTQLNTIYQGHVYHASNPRFLNVMFIG
jgi:hypothetical protein